MSVTKAIDKLTDTSKLIELRMALKPAEGKRVREAFELLARGGPLPNSKGMKQKIVYLEFLQKVQSLLGLSEVALCAAALGPSAVAALNDRGRVMLPHEIKKRKARFKGEHIQSLANSYFAECMRQPSTNTQAFATTHSPCSEASGVICGELDQNAITVPQEGEHSLPALSSDMQLGTSLDRSKRDQSVTCKSKSSKSSKLFSNLGRVIDRRCI